MRWSIALTVAIADLCINAYESWKNSGCSAAPSGAAPSGAAQPSKYIFRDDDGNIVEVNKSDSVIFTKNNDGSYIMKVF